MSETRETYTDTDGFVKYHKRPTSRPLLAQQRENDHALIEQLAGVIRHFDDHHVHAQEMECAGAGIALQAYEEWKS